MKNKLFCLIFLIILLPLSAKSEIYNTPDGQKVEITLVPDKSEILLNEPMYFSLEIKNLSENEIAFVDGGDYRNEFGRAESFAIAAKDIDGNEAKKIVSKMNFGGLISPRKIPVEGKQTLRFLTSHWVNFEKTGNYIISCQKKMIIRKYETPDKFDWFNSPAIDVNVKAEIAVKPYNYTKMGEIIDSFGNNIFSENSAKRTEVIRALTFIDDKRIIKYFIKINEKISAKDRNYDDFKYFLFRALASFKDETAFKTIISHINSADDETRRYVAIALSSSKHPKAEEYLLTMRNDKSYSIRLDVVHYLGKTKTAKSTKILKTMVNDSSKSIQDETQRYLKERGEVIN